MNHHSLPVTAQERTSFARCLTLDLNEAGNFPVREDLVMFSLRFGMMLIPPLGDDADISPREMMIRSALLAGLLESFPVYGLGYLPPRGDVMIRRVGTCHPRCELNGSRCFRCTIIPLQHVAVSFMTGSLLTFFGAHSDVLLHLQTEKTLRLH